MSSSACPDGQAFFNRAFPAAHVTLFVAICYGGVYHIGEYEAIYPFLPVFFLLSLSIWGYPWLESRRNQRETFGALSCYINHGASPARFLMRSKN